MGNGAQRRNTLARGHMAGSYDGSNPVDNSRRAASRKVAKALRSRRIARLARHTVFCLAAIESRRPRELIDFDHESSSDVQAGFRQLFLFGLIGSAPVKPSLGVALSSNLCSGNKRRQKCSY
jgi:hypothetical protein